MAFPAKSSGASVGSVGGVSSTGWVLARRLTKSRKPAEGRGTGDGNEVLGISRSTSAALETPVSNDQVDLTWPSSSIVTLDAYSPAGLVGEDRP